MTTKCINYICDQAHPIKSQYFISLNRSDTKFPFSIHSPTWYRHEMHDGKQTTSLNSSRGWEMSNGPYQFVKTCTYYLIMRNWDWALLLMSCEGVKMAPSSEEFFFKFFKNKISDSHSHLIATSYCATLIIIIRERYFHSFNFLFIHAQFPCLLWVAIGFNLYMKLRKMWTCEVKLSALLLLFLFVVIFIEKCTFAFIYRFSILIYFRLNCCDVILMVIKSEKFNVTWMGG